MADAICLGELLIDFLPTVTGVELQSVPAFKKLPGGALTTTIRGAIPALPDFEKVQHFIDAQV